MVLVPTVAFFGVRAMFDTSDRDRDMWAGIAALVAVQIVIGGIVIWKYAEDFKAVFVDGTGDVPYDASQ